MIRLTLSNCRGSSAALSRGPPFETTATIVIVKSLRAPVCATRLSASVTITVLNCGVS